MEYKNRNNASKAEIEAIATNPNPNYAYPKYATRLMSNTYIKQPELRVSHMKEVQQKIMNRTRTRNNATKNHAERETAAEQARKLERLHQYMENIVFIGPLKAPTNTSEFVLTQFNEFAKGIPNVNRPVGNRAFNYNPTESYEDNVPHIGDALRFSTRKAVEHWDNELLRKQTELADRQRRYETGLLRPIPNPSLPLGQWKDTLYNPSDGTPLSKPNPKDNLTDLLGLIDDLAKAQSVVIPDVLGSSYGVDKTTKLYGFIEKIFLNPKITMDEMVSFKFVRGKYIGADSYECLSQLFVFFGGIEGVLPRNDGMYKFVERFEINRELGDRHKHYPTNSYMLNATGCLALNTSGFSDVTLMHNCIFDETIPPPENGKKVYLASVKWLSNETSATKDYDIETLRAFSQDIAKYVPGLVPENVINLVFLKNRKQFANKCFSADRHEENWCEQIYGWIEDVKPFLEIVRNKIFEIADTKMKTPMDIFDRFFDIRRDVPNNSSSNSSNNSSNNASGSNTPNE
jgi:hypothetical protein